MDAPKCPVCGKSAYPAQAWMHKDCKVANSKTVANKVVNTAQTVANKHGVYADKEKRRIYMREYMAKRRLTKEPST